MAKGDLEKFKVAKDIVLMTEAQFVALAGEETYQKESLFALQLLKDNSYLCGVAYQNKDSLRSAVLNIAAIGLTLNPVRRLAYLVPRDGRVMADISYMGLIQMAIDSGSIDWAKAELVYAADTFTWMGLDKCPEHSFDPFGERGELKGVYCVAKLSGGDFLSEVMTISDVFEIRNRSQSWKAGKNSPWKSDEGEMIKKTVLRRAYKSWPIKSSVDKFDKAFETFDSEFTSEVDVTPQDGCDALIDKAILLLAELDRPLDGAIDYLNRAFQRKIVSLECLTKYELEKFIAQLESWLAKKPKLELDNDCAKQTIGEENENIESNTGELEIVLEEISSDN